MLCAFFPPVFFLCSVTQQPCYQGLQQNANARFLPEQKQRRHPVRPEIVMLTGLGLLGSTAVARATWSVWMS